MPATITKCGPLGPYANNTYIVVDDATRAAIFVDAPFGSESALEAIGDARMQQIVITHRHGDHWAEIDVVKAALGVPVVCHESDRAPYDAKVDSTVHGDELIALGETLVRVIHTPGHTPGSICLLVPTAGGHDVLISGDTLFPGGPGRSDSPAALKEMVQSIVDHLLVLPDDTQVYPGHGDNTTIAAAKREHAVFASKQHPKDLCGDVTWE